MRLEDFIFLSTLQLLLLSLGEWCGKRRFLQGWLFSHGLLPWKILITDNLCKRHIIVLDWCYMCKRCEESVDHLLLHYPIAFELWSLVFCLFGIHWVMPHKVIELFEYWQGKFGRHRNIGFRRLMPHCLMWCIWSERNARCFEGSERSLLEIKGLFG